jgi:hypothetical protein
MNPSQLTVDWSSWSLDLRVELLHVVEDLHAKAVAGVVARPDTLTEAHPADLPAIVEPSGWNKESYSHVIGKLLARHQVQVAVIFEAIKTGTGYVPRHRVYELGGYDAERSLKGFTRPVNRFTADAVEAGLLPEDADELLAPDYDPAISGYHRARGFVVPMEVVKLGLQWKAEQEVLRRQD